MKKLYDRVTNFQQAIRQNISNVLFSQTPDDQQNQEVSNIEPNPTEVRATSTPERNIDINDTDQNKCKDESRPCSQLSDASETYNILDTSAHLNPDDEQLYQNIVDMDVVQEKVKSQKCCHVDKDDSKENDTGVQDVDSFGEEYVDNFDEKYSRRQNGKDEVKERSPSLKIYTEKVEEVIYDIPKIQFSFLENPNRNDRQSISPESNRTSICKSEIKITLSPPKSLIDSCSDIESENKEQDDVVIIRNNEQKHNLSYYPILQTNDDKSESPKKSDEPQKKTKKSKFSKIDKKFNKSINDIAKIFSKNKVSLKKHDSDKQEVIKILPLQNKRKSKSLGDIMSLIKSDKNESIKEEDVTDSQNTSNESNCSTQEDKVKYIYSSEHIEDEKWKSTLKLTKSRSTNEVVTNEQALNVESCLNKSKENTPVHENVLLRENKPESNDFHKTRSRSLISFDSNIVIDENLSTKKSKNVRKSVSSQTINTTNTEEKKPIKKHVSLDAIEMCKSDDQKNISIESNSELEYCAVRKKMPPHLGRITLIRNRILGVRERLTNTLINQAANQRVGAQIETATSFAEEYPRATAAVDKAIKSTKSKLGKLNSKLKRKKHKKIYESEFDVTEIIDDDSSSIPSKFLDSNSIITSSSVNIKSNESSRLKSSDDDNDFDFKSLKLAFRKSRFIATPVPEGQNGFDDLRRYVKQGGDFCKELSAILMERAEAEQQYSKTLAKLSLRLTRAARACSAEAWLAVAHELEARANGHARCSLALSTRVARPLRRMTDTHHTRRKTTEASTTRAARVLNDWRVAEAKAKKHSHTCARDNEKLQDDIRLTRSNSLIHLTHTHNQKTVSDKENNKHEVKKRKAEEAVKRADIEYYNLCVRAERARLDWESAILRGADTFQSLEEERLNSLKAYLTSYLEINTELAPELTECTEVLRGPIDQYSPICDLQTYTSLRQSSLHAPEQLLPDFYCEHITLAMNRERRKQALVKLLHLIRQDLERERKSKHGLENLSRAIKQTPNFGSDDSQQNVSEKLYHMCSMLTYLEAARYKVQSALVEIDNKQQRISHPLAPHITVVRDKSGLQQSILKVPPWLRDEANKATTPLELPGPCEDWPDRGVGDGNSNQPDSDFDEFSSQSSCDRLDSNETDNQTDAATNKIDDTKELSTEPICKCRALYAYSARLPDELNLSVGDELTVYRQQADGWWLGECSGKIGIFPATYVEVQQ